MTKQICCRCELALSPPEHLFGGSYGGVVCRNHRSCISCWFDEAPGLGKRAEESDETKKICFVDKPFHARDVKCPGCFNQLPPYVLPSVPLVVVLDDGTIDLT